MWWWSWGREKRERGKGGVVELKGGKEGWKGGVGEGMELRWSWVREKEEVRKEEMEAWWS